MKHRDTSNSTEADLRWRPAALVFMLGIVAALALGAAIVTQRWQLLVFAAPMIGVLATAPLQI